MADPVSPLPDIRQIRTGKNLPFPIFFLPMSEGRTLAATLEPLHSSLPPDIRVQAINREESKNSCGGGAVWGGTRPWALYRKCHAITRQA